MINYNQPIWGYGDMDDKPAFRKTQGTEIKHINGPWYLTEDSASTIRKQRTSHKVSGPLLGRITTITM